MLVGFAPEEGNLITSPAEDWPEVVPIGNAKTWLKEHRRKELSSVQKCDSGGKPEVWSEGSVINMRADSPTDGQGTFLKVDFSEVLENYIVNCGKGWVSIYISLTNPPSFGWTERTTREFWGEWNGIYLAPFNFSEAETSGCIGASWVDLQGGISEVLVYQGDKWQGITNCYLIDGVPEQVLFLGGYMVDWIKEPGITQIAPTWTQAEDGVLHRNGEAFEVQIPEISLYVYPVYAPILKVSP